MSVGHRILGPFVLPGMTVGVLALIMAWMDWREGHGRLQSLWWAGDLEVAVMVLLPGTAIFWGVSRVLLELDGDVRPGLREHLRHAGLLYLALVVSVALLARAYLREGGGPGSGLWIIATLVAAHAVVVNAVVVWRHRGAQRVSQTRRSPTRP